MASISKTDTGKFRVQFYDSEKHKRSKVFATNKEAKRFVALLELSPEERVAKITFASLMEEYRDNVTNRKRGVKSEALRINRLMQRDFARLPLSSVTTQIIQKFADERLEETNRRTGNRISPASVRKELVILSAIMNYAVKRGLLPKNPVSAVEKPKEDPHRERTASEEDIQKLLHVSGWDGQSVPQNSVQLVMLAFLFACKTGMRSGEIIKLEKCWIEGRVIHLPKEATKTDAKRDVALSSEALRLLNLAIEYSDKYGVRVFDTLNDSSRDALFRKIRDKAGLGAVTDSQGRVVKEGLNFHDSRATFATWAASPDPRTGAPRLDVLALARQTGHRDLRMLQRYYRKTAAEIAEQLD
jgi:integrase